MSKKYLIIGAGIAGLTAAETIRKFDGEGEITLLTKETILPYSRPMLTKSPFSAFDPKHWTVHEEKWYEDNEVSLKLGEEALSIDHEKKEAVTAKGTYPYDTLIFATGSSNFIPPFEGKDKEGVFTIREDQDIYAIKQQCLPESRAVIIGGGVIGIEAALELLRYGVSCTILEAMPYLMMRQIDEEISDKVREVLADRVEVETGVTIEAIAGEEAAEAVVLADGRVYPCDFVIVACGTRANTQLPESIGVEIDRAVVIDDHARTNLADVYACGDCAQYKGINYALWSQGMLQGETAGANAAGREASFDTVDSSLIITSPELSLLAIGDLGKDPEKEYEIKYLTKEADDATFFVNPRHGAFFEKQYWIGDKLAGVGIIGNLGNMQDRKERILGETEVSYVE